MLHMVRPGCLGSLCSCPERNRSEVWTLHRTRVALAPAPLSGGGGNGKEQVKRETGWTEAEMQRLLAPGASVSLSGELVAL